MQHLRRPIGYGTAQSAPIKSRILADATSNIAEILTIVEDLLELRMLCARKILHPDEANGSEIRACITYM